MSAETTGRQARVERKTKETEIGLQQASRLGLHRASRLGLPCVAWHRRIDRWQRA